MENARNAEYVQPKVQKRSDIGILRGVRSNLQLNWTFKDSGFQSCDCIIYVYDD